MPVSLALLASAPLLLAPWLCNAEPVCVAYVHHPGACSDSPDTAGSPVLLQSAISTEMRKAIPPNREAGTQSTRVGSLEVDGKVPADWAQARQRAWRLLKEQLPLTPSQLQAARRWAMVLVAPAMLWAATSTRTDPPTIVCCYVGASIAMNVLNKEAATNFKATFLLVIIQMVFASFAVLGIESHKMCCRHWQDLVRWTVVPLAFAGMLATSMWAMREASLSAVLILKNLLPIISFAAEKALFNTPVNVSTSILLSLFLTFVGCGQLWLQSDGPTGADLLPEAQQRLQLVPAALHNAEQHSGRGAGGISGIGKWGSPAVEDSSHKRFRRHVDLGILVKLLRCVPRLCWPANAEARVRNHGTRLAELQQGDTASCELGAPRRQTTAFVVGWLRTLPWQLLLVQRSQAACRDKGRREQDVMRGPAFGIFCC
jgi:hypothetical protein